MPIPVLGISAYYHDSAACLLVDGRIVAAAQEERFTRKKHDPAFPSHAIEYCLREADVTLDGVAAIAFHEKPLVKFDRLLETYLATAPRGLRSYLTAMPLWLGEKLWMRDEIQRELGTREKILFGDHHESHAASAFYPSPFEEAAVLTIDGVGEWTTASIAHGTGADLAMIREMRFPHSLGLLYSAFTYFTGFTVNDGEYKLMGLAPYGQPTFVDAIREHLVEIHEDGSIRLNLEYFEFTHGLRMTGAAFERLFGGPRRAPESPITQRERNLARSVQAVTEDVMLRMARTAHRDTGSRRLCMAGGVALNCVANGRILREGLFDHLWIQPAAGDAGAAVGAAYAVWHRYLRQPRVSAERAGTWEPTLSAGTPRAGLPRYADGMDGALLGPRFTDDEIADWLQREGIESQRRARRTLPSVIAELIAAGKVVGLFQGRMEFGPRALGCRSIVADARGPTMQSTVNERIKSRESFRPFAPSVLREHVADWFALDRDSPYMLLVADVVRVGELPAVTHVDDSARIQTVRREDNPLYYDIIQAFHALTGCPVVLNTSFNVRDEPIVCTPADAYRCFLTTEMDVLILESHVIQKT